MRLPCLLLYVLARASRKMIVELVITVVLFMLATPVLKWCRNRVKVARIINKIPGPPSYLLVGTTYLAFGVSREGITELLYKLHNEYPIILRHWLGPMPQVELKRAEHIEKILSTGKAHLQKSWVYKFLHQWLGKGLLTSDGAKWHSRRKIITPTFHFSILDGFIEIFSNKSKILLEKLSCHAGSGIAIDVYPFITKVTLDIIAEAAMGTQIYAQNETENDYVRSVYETAELILRRVHRPWLYSDFIYKHTADGKKWTAYLELLHGFTKKVIKQRRETRNSEQITEANGTSEDNNLGKKKRLAFLDLLLETKLENGDQLSDDDIREEVDTFMFEGHDTTTAALTWTLCMLGLHPEIQETVYEELNGIFGNSERPEVFADFGEMKVLDRVIKETLRLYPSVPIIGRTLSEEVQLDEYILPKGCTVTIEIAHLHRDERFFPDSYRFDPDRFLPENTVGRHPFAYLPFSAGARNCIGQKFAILEEKAILSAIIRRYRFRTVDKREDIKAVFELTYRPASGIRMIFEERTTSKLL